MPLPLFSARLSVLFSVGSARLFFGRSFGSDRSSVGMKRSASGAFPFRPSPGRSGKTNRKAGFSSFDRILQKKTAGRSGLDDVLPPQRASVSPRVADVSLLRFPFRDPFCLRRIRFRAGKCRLYTVFFYKLPNISQKNPRHVTRCIGHAFVRKAESSYYIIYATRPRRIRDKIASGDKKRTGNARPK